MSSANPSGPSQPPQEKAYQTHGNPVTKEPSESRMADANTQSSSATVERRVPTEQTSSLDDATPSSLAQGVREATTGDRVVIMPNTDDQGQNELDADQMAPPGEGKVYDAVVGQSSGRSGEQPDLASDIDRRVLSLGRYRFGYRAQTDTRLGKRLSRLHIEMPYERIVSETLISEVY